jgi:predicted DNA-binding transcriptional regulator YafY
VIDRFGRDVIFTPDGEAFLVTVPVAVSPPFYAWLLSFGPDAELLSPADEREKLQAYLDGIREKYNEK